MKKRIKFSPFSWVPVFCLLSGATVVEPELAKPQTIHFQYQKYILLDAEINQQYAAKLLLDTGADELLLDAEYFNSTGMVVHRSQQSTLPGAGSTPQNITIVLDRMQVQLGFITYMPHYVPLMDLRSIVGEKADGIIGTSFLQPYLPEIDFEKEVMTLHTDRSVLMGFDSIQLEVRGNRYYLPVSIEAAEGLVINGMFQLDLGNGGTVYLTSPTAQAYALESKIQKKLRFYSVSGGAGGRIEGYKFRAKSLTIGQTRLLLPHVDWSTDKAGALASSEYTGILGNTILERFRVILDLKKGMLYLQQKPNSLAPFVGAVTGLGFVNKSKTAQAAIVTGLLEGGHADKAGLKVGDRIVAINGVQVTDMDDKQLEALFDQTGEPLHLVFVRDGQTQNVQLARVELL